VPPARQTLSKSRVTRAGETVRRWFLGEPALPSDDEFVDAVGVLVAWRQAHAYPLSLVTPGVRKWVSQEIEPFSPVVVAQRLKRLDRMVEKLGRLRTIRLAQMEDIAGCRAVVHDPAEVEAVARRIYRKWDVRAVNDYREVGNPKTGYRGLHVIVLRRERRVEIQLRTIDQNNWAELVERTSSRTRYNLKDGEGPADLIEYLRVASDIFWEYENGREASDELTSRMKELRRTAGHYFHPGSTTRRQREG